MRKLAFRVGWTLLALFVGAALVPPLITPFLIAFTFFFGWVRFLWRTLSEVTIDPASVGLAVVAVILVGFLGQSFGRWFVSQQTDTETRWRSWWTFAGLALVLLAFASGTAMIGVVHQIGWLARTGPPFLDEGRGAMQAARRSCSKMNLKEIGFGFHNYHAAADALPRGITLDSTGRPLHGWCTALLPLLEEPRLAETIDHDIPWDDPRNRDAFVQPVWVFRNPGHFAPDVDARGYAITHYAGNAHVLFDTELRLRDITDGLGNTILAGEVRDEFVAWGNPLNLRDPALGINAVPHGFGGPFEGGSHFVLADGSVYFLSEDVAPSVLKALATPRGGETVAVP